MTTTPKTKCSNPGPLNITDLNGEPLRSTICPECGGNLMILSSGTFRSHRRVFKEGDPRIQQNVDNLPAR